ncbi:BTAD domain-containing putative transcriptional regulator [Micromonospora lupini]|uniref:BTAD domain-containing putative transcriptional regulator n=1 Tax=Micromonospora lupini TaxID=285679 RepID=UPI0033D0F381
MDYRAPIQRGPWNPLTGGYDRLIMLLRVLGPIGLETEAGPVDLGGRRQRSVLALLTVARGEVVSVDRLTAQVWGGAPPPKAAASLHAYVSNLRRILEPGRPPRTPSKILVSAAPGYALRLGPDAVDAWRFERAVADAAGAQPTSRLQLLDALDLWRGDAYAEFAAEPWARNEATRLNELRLAARELLIDIELKSGDVTSAIADSEMLLAQAPLREEAWRLLALALWRGGRQGDALAAIRRARGVLAEELGLDPGPPLRDLEAAILRQEAMSPPPPRVATEAFVGRRTELAALRRTATTAVVDGPRICVISGEPGAGKTTLLTHLSHALSTDGWHVASGRCFSADGTPPAWAWVEALKELDKTAPPTDDLVPILRPMLKDTGGPSQTGDAAADRRFRLHRAVLTWLRQAACIRPLAVVLDDVQDGDDETLRLLASVAGLTEAPVLLVVAHRPAAGLSETLALLARQSPLRVHLDGLDADEVGQLIGTVTGAPISAETVTALAARTGGNPFYVKELARLFAVEGELAALSAVPEGVRDVLRRRLALLPATALPAIRLAAVAGAEAEVEVLSMALDAEVSTGGAGAGTDLVEALEAGLDAGLLTEPAPGRVRFAHDLVRETVYTDVPLLRRAGMHARIAASIAVLHPEDHSALAHHYARSGSSATARLAVEHAIRAAEIAERRFAYDTAISLLSIAEAGAATDDVRVDVLGRLMRAQARAGASAAIRETRARAVEIAVSAARDDLLIAAFAAWNVPTPWLTRAYGTIDRRAVDLLTRLLNRDDLTPLDRCQLLVALTTELDGEGDPLGVAAGLEALTLARDAGDPETYALGLTARLRTMRWNREIEERRDLALILRDLATVHGLVSYRWFAEETLAHTASLLQQPDTLHAVVARQQELARIYHLHEAQAINLGSRGGLAHVAGDFAGAQRFYDEAAALMRAHGNLHADLFQFFATTTLLISQNNLVVQLPATRRFRAVAGPLLDDLLALNLAVAGEWESARRVPVAEHPLRPDHFESGMLTIRAMAVVALGRTDLAERTIEALRPFAERLGGFDSASIAFRPVAHSLADLHRLVNRPAEAARYYRLAAEVAERWNAPHWFADARAALTL